MIDCVIDPAALHLPPADLLAAAEAAGAVIRLDLDCNRIIVTGIVHLTPEILERLENDHSVAEAVYQRLFEQVDPESWLAAIEGAEARVAANDWAYRAWHHRPRRPAGQGYVKATKASKAGDKGEASRGVSRKKAPAPADDIWPADRPALSALEATKALFGAALRRPDRASNGAVDRCR
jgi:hypothetical protein